MKRTVCIRVDGSANIGTGHVIRCLALAKELAQTGFKIVFCTKDFDSNLINRIISSGFKVSVMPAGVSLEEDMQYFTNLGKKHNADIVITDNYHFIDSYQKYLKENFRFLISIDDIAETFFYSDILINQNINATPEIYKNKISKWTKMFLGPTYALLMPEFKEYHNYPRNFDKVKNIIITFGGGDPQNLTFKVLKILDSIEADFSITVVIGMTNNNKENIIKYAGRAKREIDIKENVSNSIMAELILKADIAIGAGGSTSWEFCCLGVPFIIIFFADNQKGVAEGLHKRGIAINLGYYKYLTENDIKETVERLIENHSRRQLMSLKGREVVDGLGARRIVDEIIKL
ncbi:MAG: UDP-2,4-diacetamido-2,4,6-trideoxy-beta-L-altropyranose hydrolase [candidate division WOR-3 bacterium]